MPQLRLFATGILNQRSPGQEQWHNRSCGHKDAVSRIYKSPSQNPNVTILIESRKSQEFVGKAPAAPALAPTDDTVEAASRTLEKSDNPEALLYPSHDSYMGVERYTHTCIYIYIYT